MTIKACGEDCQAPNWAEEGLKWCSFPVELPYNIWGELCHKKDDSAKKTSAALKDIDLWVVENEEDVQPAMDALYNSMRDPIIGIDTEWKFDTAAHTHDTAMISLASSSTVVLIRTSIFCAIPKPVRTFCRDDEIVGVAFGWEGDEKKLQYSFDIGRKELFSHFIDLKPLVDKLGFHEVSINSLSRLTLGFEPPKSQHVTMSDWESSSLSAQQVRYAALDALIAADVFRALRLFHERKPDCPGCTLPLGGWPEDRDLHCRDPDCKHKKPYGSINALMQHVKMTGHVTNLQKCSSCGRISNTWSPAAATTPPAQQPPSDQAPQPSQAQPPQPAVQAAVQATAQATVQQRPGSESLEEMLEKSLNIAGLQEESFTEGLEPQERLAHTPSGRKKKYQPKPRKRNANGSMYAAYNSYL